jgi:hypothetical protein
VVAHHPPAHTFSIPDGDFLMYDMYPEWGPGRHRDDNDEALQSVQVGLDLRDNGGQRPDDN